VMAYSAVCVIFPVIALLMAMVGAGAANVAGERPRDDPPRRPPGPPGPEPAPGPSGLVSTGGYPGR
jgi:hypothetical protein